MTFQNITNIYMGNNPFKEYYIIKKESGGTNE
jgi:hypothetical protein